MTIQPNELNGFNWLTVEQYVKILLELLKHAKSKAGKNLPQCGVVLRAVDVEAINFEVVMFADAQRDLDEIADVVSESEALAIKDRNRKMRKFAERALKNPVSAEELIQELRAFGDIQSGNACFRSFGITKSTIDQDGVPHNLDNSRLPKDFDAERPHRLTGLVSSFYADKLDVMKVQMRVAKTFDSDLFEKTDLCHRHVVLTMQPDDLWMAFVSFKDGVTMTVDVQLRITTVSDGLEFTGHVLAVINSQELQSSLRSQVASQTSFDTE